LIISMIGRTKQVIHFLNHDYTEEDDFKKGRDWGHILIIAFNLVVKPN